MTNLYYNTVKMLLERTSSVMVDHDAIKVIFSLYNYCLKIGYFTIENNCPKFCI